MALRPRRTKEAVQSRLEAQVMAEHEAEKVAEREEWVTGGRMPTTYRDPRTGKLSSSRAHDAFIGPRLPSFIEALPLSMSEEEYNAAMDALAAGTITKEQEEALDRFDQEQGEERQDLKERLDRIGWRDW
jgi:hypothetical protein